MRSTSSSAIDVESRGFASASPAFAIPQRCRHCITPLAGRYCHACGEDALRPATSWQSRFAQWHRLARTMRSLWLRPGELAVRHLQGAGYIPPVTLFLNAVALFFLFSAATQFQRIASHRWPMAIAKGLVVAACGMVIDTLMSVIAVGISLRLA